MPPSLPTRRSITALAQGRRPGLRLQLTLLYSGLFLGLLAAVLLVTNLLYNHTASRAPANAIPHPGTASHHLDIGPAIIGIVAAGIAFAGAWWLAGRFLQPLHTITAAAKEISATDLNRRLDLTGSNDELTVLGETLNNLFERLEASFDAQRHFVANASHELRTPLAGTRTLLQVALADPDANADSLRAACIEALRLGDQQENLINALFTLATSERGIAYWEPFDLADLTETVLLSRQPEAETHQIRIDTALIPAHSTGDPRLVELLIANLIDNAIRHNIPGGHVKISTVAAPGTATITVGNTGPVIPPDQIERIFEPFQQAHGQRIGHTNGYGLGLAIVAAIARTHHAKITAYPRADGGLDIAITFPTED